MPLVDTDTFALPSSYPVGAARPQEPVTPPEKDVGWGEMFGAAFRQANTVVSFVTQGTMGVDNVARDRSYSPWSEIVDTQYEQYWERFVDSYTPEYTAALKSQIDMELSDRQTLAASGWTGFAAEMAASIVDPTILIPAFGTAAKVGTGYRILRGAGAGAASAAVGVAAQEALLQGSQEIRPLAESAANVGFGVILGGILGGGAAALLSKAEREAVQEAYDKVMGFTPAPAPAGAAVTERLAREDLTVAGTAAKAVADVTAGLNPNLRTFQRASGTGRQYLLGIYENTTGTRANERGLAVTPGGAVETDARRTFASRIGDVTTEILDIYKEMKKAGMNIPKADFYEAIGRAARRGDVAEDGNMYVSRAAQNLRAKVLEPYRQDLINEGLIPPDASITTAMSYFPKLRNVEMMVARKGEWTEAVTRYLASTSLPEQFAKDKQRLAARTARIEQQLADMKLDAPARLKTLKDIETAGAALDEANPEAIDILGRVTEQERVAREARKTGDAATAQRARDEVRRLRQEGGDALRAYEKQRAELRRRRRDVSFNAAGNEARVEALRQRLTDIEDQNIRSLQQLIRRGQMVEKAARRWDPDAIQAKLDDLTDRFEAEVRAAERAETQATEVLAKARQKLEDKRAAYEKAEKDFKAKAKAAKNADPMAKPALDQAAYEAQQKKLKAEIDIAEQEVAAKERIAETQRNYAERITALQDRMEAVAELDPEARMAEVRAVTEAMVEQRSGASLARGQRAQRILEQMENYSPERATARIKQLETKRAAYDADFNERWGKRVDDVDAPDFADAARRIADDVYAKIVDGDMLGEDFSDLPGFVTRLDRGPMRERTLNIPDEIEEQFLISDADQVVRRYARIASGAISLKKFLRRNGFETPKEMYEAISADYNDMIQKVVDAPTVADAMAIVGREPGVLDNFKAWAGREDVKATKEKLLTWLRDDKVGLLEDLDAGVKMNQGVYKLRENNTGFGIFSQRANMYNYARLSGNFGLSSITEIYRAAFSHGVRPFLQEGIAPLLTNLKTLKLQQSESKLAGLVTERVLNHRLFAAGEIGDPFAQGKPIDRLLRNLSSIATRWNGIALFQDASESIAGALTQNRIFKGLLKGGDDEFLARLELGPNERERVKRMFEAYGRVEDDALYVANSRFWDDQYAVDAFRNALNKATGLAVTRPGLGDTPLFTKTPLGKTITQFLSFALAGHQRATINLLQDKPRRVAQLLVGTTAVGIFISWLVALRSGQEGYEKWLRNAENPGWLIGEGLDRGGFLPLIFLMANTTEKAAGAVLGNNINPIKTPLAAAFGEQGDGVESTRVASRSPLEVIAGPTFGSLDTAARAAGGAVDLLRGDEPSSGEIRAAASLTPLANMPVAKEVLQMLTGDSPYVP